MKRTFTINISGIIFHIDDDAYDKLNQYLGTIKRHFSGTGDSEEIINDIEMRIAEIMQGKLSDKKQVINLADVQEVISIMGDPNDFDDTGEGPAGTDRKDQEAYHYHKRLYRDPESKMLGGVSSGLGAYFNIDPVWIRLIFVLLTVFSGVGILLYIILWIVVPVASTTAERLEMRGEPVNISNIERSIREEVDHLKDKLNDLTDGAKRTFKKKSSQVRSGSDPVAGFLGEAGRIILKLLVALVGLIVLITGIGLTIALIATIIGVSHGFWIHDGAYFFPFSEFLAILIEDPSNLPVINTTLILVFGIPVFMLLVTGIRLLFALPRQKTLSVIAFNVWLIALIVLIVFTVMTASDFREEEVQVRKTEWPSPPGGIVYLQLNSQGYEDPGDNLLVIDDWKVVVSPEGRIKQGMPELRIEKSSSGKMMLIMESGARGKDERRALERAGKITYSFDYNDSVMTFHPYFSTGPGSVWRKQELELILRVPEGTLIDIGDDMHKILGFHRDYYKDEMSGRRFIMGPDGLTVPGENDIDTGPSPSGGRIGSVGFIVTGLRVF